MKSREVDDYIKGFPKETQNILKEIRKIISELTPNAEEVISYGIPTFKLKGNLVHFGGYKNHIGFFPTPSAVFHFKKELLAFKTSKGSIQFKLEEPIPYSLISKITKFRIKENLKCNKKLKHTILFILK